MKNDSVKCAVRAALALSASAAVCLPILAQEAGDAQAVAEATEMMPATVLEEVVVTGRQRTAADEVLAERIEAEVVADLVSAEQISRVGDSTVSLALRRLPGVTLVGDQFIYIRGLGERYSSTTVNGAYVPSPDLTRNVIPLDLFPAEIVDSISIQKGFTPDKPAAFGGGNVDIRTRSIPESLTFGVQVGTGWNSESSGKGLTYPGGGDDNLGDDDGTRALPATIDQAIQAYRGNFSVSNIAQTIRRQDPSLSLDEANAQAAVINRELAVSLNRDTELQQKSLNPDMSLEASLGNSWYFGVTEAWKLGFLALGDYKNEWRDRERTTRAVNNPDLVYDETQRTTHKVVLTGSLGIGLDFSDEQRIEATGIFLRNTEDDASISTGFDLNRRQADGSQLRNYDIRYEQRELELFQLRGSHSLGTETLALLEPLVNLGFAEDLRFDWYYSDATATTDIPSEIRYSAQDRIDPVTGEVLQTAIRSTISAAEYRFTELEDEAQSYGTALSFPFSVGNTEFEVSGGYDYYQKGRGYLQTQVNFGTQAGAAQPILVGTPGTVFTDENILDPANGFVTSVGGIGTESYLAGETVTAAWGKVDFTWNDTWRFTGGARWEDFERVSAALDPLNYVTSTRVLNCNGEDLSLPGKLPFCPTVVQEDDYYPSVAITYIRPGFWSEDFQLRFGWSETVARPDLREVSRATYIDPLTEARVRGNPDLLNSSLKNFDIRGEWFFANNNNFTVSLFYKDIQDPIETIQGAGTDDNVTLTFVNGESAEVYGLEIEGLAGLGFLSGGGWTDSFFVSGNVTLSDSEITIGDAAEVTNNTRRMTQHSEYVVNMQLGFDSPGGGHSASFVYSVYGPRIFFAGRGGAGDAYEQAFNSLDLVYNWYATDSLSLRLRLQNILDEKTEIVQDGVTVLEQTVGTTAKLDLTYRF
jgi:TonB-dependent receptor